jgi:chromosomal replication initiator protein
METSNIKDIIDKISELEQRLLTHVKAEITAKLPKELESKVAESEYVELFGEEVVKNIMFQVLVTVLEDMRTTIVSLLKKSDLEGRKNIKQSKQIDEYIKIVAQKTPAAYIQKVVCDYFKVPIADILSLSRVQHVSLARQTVMYFMRKYTDFSMEKIGANCGKRDHATVLHGCREIELLRNSDEAFKVHFDILDEIIGYSLT